MPPGRNPESESAYDLWAHDCKQSVQCVSRELQIPERTVQYWRRQYRWHERRQADLLPELFSVVSNIKVDASLAMQNAVPVLVEIMHDTRQPARERVIAIRALNEIYRTMVLAALKDHDPTSMVDAQFRLPESAPGGSDVTAVDILEANIAESEQAANKRGRSR